MAKVNPNKFGDIVKKATDTAIERLVTKLSDIIIKEIKSQVSGFEKFELIKHGHNQYELNVDATIDIRKLCMAIIVGMMKQ